MAGESRFHELMAGTFSSVDREAEDEHGGGQLRLYAVGEQALPGEFLILQLLATGILEEPEPGRWALVFRAKRSPFLPHRWELTDLIQVPPESAEQVLALGALPEPRPDPESYPEGFAAFVGELRRAIRDSNSASIAAGLKTSPFTCTEPPAPLASVPACVDQPAGSTVDVVRWDVYCLACDAIGYATPGEIEAWLDRLFATAQTSSADNLGPAEVQHESVSQRLPEGRLSITVTGIGDMNISDLPRRPGRWVITFHAQPRGDTWGIVGLTLADPDASRWVLPTLRGTNVVWTLWPPID